VAYVIFKDKSSVSRATSMPFNCQRLLSSDKCRLISGLESKLQLLYACCVLGVDILRLRSVL